MPIVSFEYSRNLLVVYLFRKVVFPTPPSPEFTILNMYGIVLEPLYQIVVYIHYSNLMLYSFRICEDEFFYLI